MTEAAAKAGVTPARLEHIENEAVQPMADELARFQMLFPVELARWTQAPNS